MGQYGELESCCAQSDAFGKPNYFIIFKRQEDAKRALLDTKENWYGYEVRVAKLLDQPDHPLLVAPDQDSHSNIRVALNDHCLLEVFKRLELRDLTNVAGLRKRFNKQAKIIFALKYKHLDLTEQLYYQTDLIESLMKHFGKDIRSLSVALYLFKTEEDAVRMIGENCGRQLKRLTFRSFRFNNDLAPLRSIFAGIEHLTLDECACKVCLDDLMAGCAALKSLTLLRCTDTDRYIEQTFPKLEELSLMGTRISDESFKAFAMRNPTMIKLSTTYTLEPQSLHTIGEHAKNLQELKFNWHLGGGKFSSISGSVECTGCGCDPN